MEFVANRIVQVHSHADEVFSEALVKELGEANSKLRLAAMEEVNSRLAGMDQVTSNYLAKYLHLYLKKLKIKPRPPGAG